MDKHSAKLSKFLSLILRHKPQVIGLQLDANGWADVEQLIDLVNQHGIAISYELLDALVQKNDKQRFTFNADHTKVRANQGHSLSVDLDLVAEQPPRILFHGTATRFLSSIREKGLLPGSRQHVHLAAEELDAIRVGQRHGHPVVLVIQANTMCQAGYQFYCAKNGVWLAERIPPQYIQFPSKVGRSRFKQ
ncbi:MAG: RNA 2'-phosphotransferase [Leptolyngbya sp. SIOISBB]|nr:RNA 2'-phosphotransferase [Leptolyngbya sp. SIOISBB]